MLLPRTRRWVGWGVIGVLSVTFSILFWFKVDPLPIEFLEKDFSTLHLDENGRLLRITLNQTDQVRIDLPLSLISDDLKQGFVFYEDRYFRFHPGFNPASLFKGLFENMQAHRVVRGGSTITMQIAKMMEPKPRTIWSKLRELTRAVQLELHYSKDELLRIYLNSVPMGGNIRGVGAAAYLYFGKSPADLSLNECALLISLPRSPNRSRPDRHPEFADKQRKKILRLIGPRIEPSISTGEELRSITSGRRKPNPFSLPHLIVRTKKLSGDAIRRYAIDPSLQAYCENVLHKSMEGLRRQGIYNGAIVVIENKSMKVRVYIGSPDFNDKKHSGQINGANIRRSPGSLLKPFLYALAIDQGRLTPRSLVYDIERNYDGYIPANFDRHFRGPVTAEEALITSLNVPAVNLEFEMGQEGLTSFIRRAGLERKGKNISSAGLSLVLGAYPLTLEELVRLFSIFPNQGELRELQFFEDGPENVSDNRVLLRPETSFILSQMLSKIERPDLPQSWEFTNTRGKIAFKTGTSFGLRDAWCVGFNPEYTVGVWLGNANAKGASELVGIRVAAPILVTIFNHLTRYHDSWLKKPAGVSEREVCSVTGEPRGPWCDGKIMDLTIPGVTRTTTCSVHQTVIVDKKTKFEVCRACMTKSREHYKEVVVDVWPPDVASSLQKMGRSFRQPPDHNPLCQAMNNKNGLKIKVPMPGGFYAVTPALDKTHQKIPFSVQSQRLQNNVYWFLDDQLLAKSPSDETVYWHPIPGEHRLTVKDGWGQSDTVRFFVRR